MVLGKKKQEEVVHVEPYELISTTEVEQIRKALIETHADLVVLGMLDNDVRAQLEKIVARDFKQATKGNPEVIAYVVRETIGTGVIEEILRDPKITDIAYNGTELVVETNDSKQVFDTEFEITDNYIIRLISKFANANNKELTAKNPIFDGRFQNVRINAVHSQNTAPESGTTMALRVVRPRLALTEKNFEGFAPMFMYDFFRAAVLTKSNIVISGTTGTGKTELHKLISRFIPFDDRIILIEDTPETFMKKMFPDKDIMSWVTSKAITITDLIKAGLRNHPTWLMVTETRGSEAYEMIQAVLSGHSIITSLHAINARAIPSRFVNMAKMGYQLSEEALLGDIHRYFHFGVHIKKTKFHGHVVRYLSEIVEFHPDGDKTIFKQRFVNGVFTFETFSLTDEFKDRMEEAMITLDFPENFKSNRPLDLKNTTFQSVIPLDKTGRPDLKKIAAMGTTLDILMGRAKPFHNPDDDEDAIDLHANRDGYIAPEIGSKSISGSEQKINQAKRRASQQAKRPVVHVPNNAMHQEERKLEDDVQRILQEVARDAPPTPKKMPPTRKAVKEQSVKELLEKKRRLIHNETL